LRDRVLPPDDAAADRVGRAGPGVDDGLQVERDPLLTMSGALAMSSRIPACSSWDLIILAACDSGTSSVHPGDELMGLAAAFLALGTRSLIASLIPVPDRATAPLMLAVHDRMSGGASPAAALAAAAVTASEGDDAGLAVAAAFACFGAG
ncbi:MAG TPA: CHAT domain-containing protein, partial [Acidimicrobiales bacterium]|nr:CHAT domain-containing protein [Acidimicrobiales bacterium]